ERYLSASWNISRAALGNLHIQPSTITYRVRPDLSQDQHIDGMPPGTRGGMTIAHTFPVDGEYIIKLRMWRNTFDLMRGMEDPPHIAVRRDGARCGAMTSAHTFPVEGEYIIKLRMWRNTFDLMRGLEDPHDIEIAMDGARLTMVTAGGRDDFGRMAENPGTFGADLDRRLTVRLPVKAGTHTIWATTVLKSQAPRDDLIKPLLKTTIDGLDIMGDPSVDRITIEGPYAVAAPGDSASRRKILQCRPTAAQGTGGPARDRAS